MEMKDSQLPSKHDSVRVLRKYTTLTNEEIFRRVGMSYSSGYRALRGGRDEEPVEKPKEKRGRKRKLNEDAVKGVIQSIESQPQGEKSQSWDELAKQTGLEGISGITIKRAVEEAGYYKCSHCQRSMSSHVLLACSIR
jgi:transposase